MVYSKIAILAAVIHCIVNRDIILENTVDSDRMPAFKEYREFLSIAMVFFLVDGMWGMLSDMGNGTLLYIDTFLYFFVMGVSVLRWTKYTVAYLEEDDLFSKVLMGSGRVFFGFEMIVLIVNVYVPVMFTVNPEGMYQAFWFRYLTFGVQFLMFLLTAVYAIYIGQKSRGISRRRHKIIGVFGLVMAVAISVQLYYPNEAVFSAGYLIVSCLLHTFIVEDIQKEYRMELEFSLEREKQQSQALAAAMNLAYTDSLTGVKSKHAYVEMEMEIDHCIAEMKANDFALVVCDLNGLKHINDTFGHDAGDRYIVEATQIIGQAFSHSSIFRIGGDEFAVFLEGEDYMHRKERMESLQAQMDENAMEGGVVIAMGIAEYQKGKDNSFSTIFKRADQEMYSRKVLLKQQAAQANALQS